MKEPKIRKQARPVVAFPSPSHADVCAARQIVGISQSQAADAAGVTERQWIRYEQGTSKMNGRLWINWCFRFDLVKPDL